MKSHEPLLLFRGVTKSFAQEDQAPMTILHQADFSLFPGETVGLVGPSGTGKSTFLNLCGLLDSWDEGDIVFRGKDVNSLKDTQRTALRARDLGLVYQNHCLIAELNALENVMMGLLIQGIPFFKAEQRSQDLLKELGLRDRMKHMPHQLSGGEQQRVSLARALVKNPRLILADEPTGNLDQKTAHQVFQMLVDRARDHHVALVMVTHQVGLAQALQRTLILQDGRIVPFQKVSS